MEGSTNFICCINSTLDITHQLRYSLLLPPPPPPPTHPPFRREGGGGGKSGDNSPHDDILIIPKFCVNSFEQNSLNLVQIH